MVKFEDLHVSQSIAPEEFEADCLTLEEYSPEEISKAVVGNVRRLSSDEEMTARQKTACWVQECRCVPILTLQVQRIIC